MLDLPTHPDIQRNFFLTGGTALSVFYLYHRLSNDIDLFSPKETDLSEIYFWMRRMWNNECGKINEGPFFLSALVKDVKVDFVIDAVSSKEKRPAILFENNRSLQVDTIDSIVSNKLCALVSRTEPKDFVDLNGYITRQNPGSNNSAFPLFRRLAGN